MNDDDDFDPMNHPSHRRTVRELSDQFRRSKGLPLLPRIEDRRATDNEAGDVERTPWPRQAVRVEGLPQDGIPLVRAATVEPVPIWATPPVIVRDPEVLAGRPVFRGTPIPPDVLVEGLALGMRLDEILASHGDLDREECVLALRQACEALKTAAR